MFAFAQVIPLGDNILLFLFCSGLVDGNNQEIDEVEQELRDEMEEEKLRYFYSKDIGYRSWIVSRGKKFKIHFIVFLHRYKESFGRLRTLKTEIEHLQHLLEKSKVKLMKDFEIWFAEQAVLNQVHVYTGKCMILLKMVNSLMPKYLLSSH